MVGSHPKRAVPIVNPVHGMSTDAKNVSSALDPEACWRVLERAAASVTLKRAARLREFLFYVGAKSLKEGRTGIHEQEIGQAVFGRRESYDTSQDNIVRVSATELRKRLNAYFASEGREEPIVFEIPRGSYVPVFRLRAVEMQPAPGNPAPGNPAPDNDAPDGPALPRSPAEPVAAESPRAAPRPRVLLALVSLVAVVLGVACAALWWQNQSLVRRIDVWKNQPALAAFWSGFFSSPQETDIVLGDASLLLIEDLKHQSYGLSDYLNRAYAEPVPTPAGGVDAKVLASIASRDDGSFGDFSVAQHIMALAPGAPNVQLEYARDFTADAVKRNNVILIGSRKSNPWVDLFADELNFDLEYNRDLDQTLVKNLHPHSGEQSIYGPPENPNAASGYSVIAYLPNHSHTANGLIIEATNSEAAKAAGDFITSEPEMQNFRSKFPGRKFPYFELLLRTSRVAGSPLKAEIVAFRTY